MGRTVQIQWEFYRKVSVVIDAIPNVYYVIFSFILFLLLFSLENMIYKGLDDDESRFLNFVAEKQVQYDAEKTKEETQELSEYRVTHTYILSTQYLLISHCIDTIYSVRWKTDTSISQSICVLGVVLFLTVPTLFWELYMRIRKYNRLTNFWAV